MSTSQKDSDAVLERARVREVTGVFRSRLALDVAAGELLLMGFDRADIDVVAGVDEIYKKLGVPYVAPEELADVPRVPRRPLVVGEDVTVFTILIAGTLGAIAAGATIYLMSFSDAGSAEIVVAAALVAIVAAGAGFLLAARIFRQDEARGLDALMAERGLILWVRARSPEQEALAQEILLSHRAEAVRVHEIELEKRPEDLPLGTIRPDPWLGSEPLARP
ncbi:MAG: hypothetical protein ACXU8R_22460 [Xanthobacteraceae bacterium]